MLFFVEFDSEFLLILRVTDACFTKRISILWYRAANLI